MHCPECNTNKKQREEAKDRFCGCCGGNRNISFHRFVQWNLGWVCWLDHEGHRDASVPEMNSRCMSIIEDCYAKVGKKMNRTVELCTDYDMSPSQVTEFYAKQFQGKDCKSSSNF